MPEDEDFVTVLKRFVVRVLVGLVVLAATVYLVDWAVWRVRVARGGGMGSVERSQVVIAPLKGGKEEYYPAETEVVACSVSMFTQAGAGACWWVERHKIVLERR